MIPSRVLRGEQWCSLIVSDHGVGECLHSSLLPLIAAWPEWKVLPLLKGPGLKVVEGIRIMSEVELIQAFACIAPGHRCSAGADAELIGSRHRLQDALPGSG